MKVVINKCYGGFSVSPEAALWMWERGYKELGISINEYFGKGSITKLEDEVAKWRTYQEGGKESVFLTVFSPDEKFVILTRPEDRTHPLLVQYIEKFGADKASGSLAELELVEIPDGIEWELQEYDGIESIHEVHRVWG